MEPTNQEQTPLDVTKQSQVLQIDEGKIQARLGEVVRSTTEETLNAMLDTEADHLCRAERYERTEARRDTRQVPTSGTCRRNGRGHAEGADATHLAVRDHHHRAIPAPEKFGGRNVDGDVACGGERTRSRRHHGGVVRHASQPEHGERTEPEDLCADRELAQPADPGEPPVRVSGRIVAQTQLGRRSAQRFDVGRYWRK
jgi:hypothetical protein